MYYKKLLSIKNHTRIHVFDQECLKESECNIAAAEFYCLVAKNGEDFGKKSLDNFFLVKKKMKTLVKQFGIRKIKCYLRFLYYFFHVKCLEKKN